MIILEFAAWICKCEVSKFERSLKPGLSLQISAIARLAGQYKLDLASDHKDSF